MSVESKKKIGAATAGVLAYLSEERERALRERPAGLPAAVVSGERAAAGPSLWAASGRQEIMHFRNLMELRALHRGR